MIPKDKCKHGYVYEIRSRNLIAGVYNEKDGSFTGIREKVGQPFLFPEFHHDNGPPYGTVQPIREIEKCPIVDIRSHFDTVCWFCKIRVKWRKTDPVARTGVWEHQAPTDCQKVHPTDPENEELFRYLKGVEARLKP